MLSVPGIQMMSNMPLSPVVSCSCGRGMLYRLGPGEALYPDGSAGRSTGINRTQRCTCTGCGTTADLVVTTQAVQRG